MKKFLMIELNDITGLECIQDWVDWGADCFNAAGLSYGHGMDNAEDESLALVLHGLRLGYDIDAGVLRNPISAAEVDAIYALLRRRVEERLPAAYIIGSTHFAGLPFLVNEHVLVPRSPIAELVVDGFHPWLVKREECRILDLCTGSGCIGMACAVYVENAQVDATDISAPALEVASANLAQLNLGDRVSLIESDLFDAVPKKKYDLIVSNPPYVDAADMAALPQEYRHEPELGLAAGCDGLDLVIRILREARQYLDADGIMIIEVGNSETSLQHRYPGVPFLWLDFAYGGHGVFLLTAQQLDEYEEEFKS